MDGCRHFVFNLRTLGLLLFLHDKAPRVVLGGHTGQKWMQRLLPWSLHLLGAECIHQPSSDGGFVFKRDHKVNRVG
jgi:hypothetical protein